MSITSSSRISTLAPVMYFLRSSPAASGSTAYTPEWILYNILEMKFLEGRKVKEIAKRLAVSEADLYRKQRIAIETLANTIIEMEMKVRES